MNTILHLDFMSSSYLGLLTLLIIQKIVEKRWAAHNELTMMMFGGKEIFKKIGAFLSLLPIIILISAGLESITFGKSWALDFYNVFGWALCLTFFMAIRLITQLIMKEFWCELIVITPHSRRPPAYWEFIWAISLVGELVGAVQIYNNTIVAWAIIPLYAGLLFLKVFINFVILERRDRVIKEISKMKFLERRKEFLAELP